MVCLSWLSVMVPNWSVLNDGGWDRPERGAGRWLESPDDAIADTGNAGQERGAFFGESSTER
jgi:hypothetical protein